MKRFTSSLYDFIMNLNGAVVEESGESTEANVRFIKYNHVRKDVWVYCLYMETLKGKKLDYYRYSTQANRDAAFDEKMKSYTERANSMQQRKESRKTATMDINPGEIFTYSWGYEQTNVDFFQVVEIKGQTVKFKQVASHLVNGEDGFMCGHAVPVPNQFIDSHCYRKNKDGKKQDHITKRIVHPNYFSMPFGIMSKWDGKPEYVSWYA